MIVSTNLILIGILVTWILIVVLFLLWIERKVDDSYSRDKTPDKTKRKIKWGR